jgi:hypothetical protein
VEDLEDECNELGKEVDEHATCVRQLLRKEKKNKAAFKDLEMRFEELQREVQDLRAIIHKAGLTTIPSVLLTPWTPQTTQEAATYAQVPLEPPSQGSIPYTEDEMVVDEPQAKAGQGKVAEVEAGQCDAGDPNDAGRPDEAAKSNEAGKSDDAGTKDDADNAAPSQQQAMGNEPAPQEQVPVAGPEDEAGAAATGIVVPQPASTSTLHPPAPPPPSPTRSQTPLPSLRRRSPHVEVTRRSPRLNMPSPSPNDKRPSLDEEPSDRGNKRRKV